MNTEKEDLGFIEKILKFSIKHRLFVLLFTIALAFYGLKQLEKLPIDAVPDITNNQIQINAEVTGLSPIQVEKQVTFVIENALKGISGLEATRSLSRSGFSQVTAIFDDGVDIYFARQQVGEKLSSIKDQLPNGVEPEMGPIATGLSEVYFWALEFEGEADVYKTSDGRILKTEEEKLGYLRYVQDWIIKPQLIGLKGLAGVDSIGGYESQIQVIPDLRKLNSLNISLKDLVEAIKSGSLAIGGGYLEEKGEALLIASDAELHSEDELKKLVIATRDGRAVYLKDVATVEIGFSPRYGSASYNGKEGVIGTALMRIGENSRTVAIEVADKLDDIESTLPDNVKLFRLLDRSKLVNSTIHTVITNLSEGALLVILVLFLMLHNIPLALITASIIPLSLLLTSIGMVKNHISGNLMSLGALDFGLIVDGTIIIAENALRKLSLARGRKGSLLSLDERLKITMESASEMIKPSLFGQAIIMVVYLPIFTLTGVEGKIFHPMAATVIFALLSAFVLSLTFVPAMIALFVKDPREPSKEGLFSKFNRFYSLSLSQVIQKPLYIIALSVFLVFSSAIIFTHMGQEFTPTLDEHDIAIQMSRGPSTSLKSATKMQEEVESALLEVPEVQLVYSKTGTAELASDPMPVDASDTFVILKPKHDWRSPSFTKEDLIEEMEDKLKGLLGNNFEFTQPIEMRFNELIGGVKSDVAVKIYGDDLAVLESLGGKIAKSLGKVKGARDVSVDVPGGSPLLSMKLNRGALSRLGLSAGDVLNTLSIALNGGNSGYIYNGDIRQEIVVRLSEKEKNDLESILKIPVKLPGGDKSVFLQDVMNLEKTDSIGQVARENGKRMVSVQVNVRGNDLKSFIDSAAFEIKKNVKIPPGYWIEYGGQFQQLLSAKKTLMVVVPVCLALIFSLLFTALHCLKNALLVFTGIPLAVTGGIFALFLSGMPFSISAAIGFIALSGIAVLNGLVLMTSFQKHLEVSRSLEEAIIESASERLRPVLMTAFVASLGFLPMALATGAGAEVQKPIAVVVIGGLLTSTTLTLLLLPALLGIVYEEKKVILRS